MIITKEEGTKLATSFLTKFCAGYELNNHMEPSFANFFASKVSWKWSDGTEGEGTPYEMLSIFKNSWGMTSSFCTHTKPLVCVDTDNGRIVLSFQIICNMDGRLGSESNIVVNKIAFVLLVNEDKKVVRWRAVWDTNDKSLLEASVKLYSKLGIEVPTPKASDNPITLEEAETFADNFLRLSTVGFPKNNHAELMKHMVANHLSWDWSDGTKGEGTPDEYFDLIANGWGMMADSWIPVNPITIVDTANSIIQITFDLVLNLTGGLKDENNAVKNTLAIALHLNKDHKITKWNLAWDNNDPALKAAVSKVTKRLESANKVAGIAVDSRMEAMVTGQ